jgi:hypothetical protein
MKTTTFAIIFATFFSVYANAQQTVTLWINGVATSFPVDHKVTFVTPQGQTLTMPAPQATPYYPAPTQQTPPPQQYQQTAQLQPINITYDGTSMSIENASRVQQFKSNENGLRMQNSQIENTDMGTWYIRRRGRIETGELVINALLGAGQLGINYSNSRNWRRQNNNLQYFANGNGSTGGYVSATGGMYQTQNGGGNHQNGLLNLFFGSN